MKKIYIQPKAEWEGINTDLFMQLPSQPDDWADSKERNAFEEEDMMEEEMNENSKSSGYSLW